MYNKQLSIYNKVCELYNNYISIYNKKTTLLKLKNNKLLKQEIILSTYYLKNDASFSERLYCILNNLFDYPICNYCNTNKIIKFKKDLFKYNDYCTHCRKEIILNKRKATCTQKYGVDNTFKSNTIKEKIKETNIQKYGVDNPTKNINIKQKQKDTCKLHYGVDNPFKSDIVKEKIKKTNNERLGVDYPSQNQEVKEKVKNTNNEKFGCDYYTQSQQYRNDRSTNSYYKRIAYLKKYGFIPTFNVNQFNVVQLKDNNINNKHKFICEKCGTERELKFNNYYQPVCNKCYPRSKQEEDIANYIKSIYKNNIIQHNRYIIKPLELDVYIPDKNLAIEYNGVYYHSEIAGGKDKNYHINKTLLCERQKIHLIHIFDDEWIFKQNIVKNKLKHILLNNYRTIYARKCTIREIKNNNIKSTFYNKYHIQGSCNTKIDLGLYYKNRLVAMMSFGNLRKSLGQISECNKWELLRFATIFNFQILGAGGKLLKYFENNYKPKYLISYADRRWSYINNVYDKLGFKLDHISLPNYWYIHNKNNYLREYRFGYRKSELPKKLKYFDNNITEWQNMINNGYDRVWDCGNLVYIKNYL